MSDSPEVGRMRLDGDMTVQDVSGAIAKHYEQIPVSNRSVAFLGFIPFTIVRDDAIRIKSPLRGGSITLRILCCPNPPPQ